MKINLFVQFFVALGFSLPMLAFSEDEKASEKRSPASFRDQSVVTDPYIKTQPMTEPTLSPSKATDDMVWTGNFDLYYIENFNKTAPTQPSTQTGTQPVGQNSYRAWDIYGSSVSVSLIEFGFKKKIDEVEIVTSIGFGSLVENLNAGGASQDQVFNHLVEGYLRYTPDNLPQLKITAGKVITHLGYEPIRAKDNLIYSRSLSFNYALPFTHTGVMAHYQLGLFTFGLYLYNNTLSAYDYNKQKMYGSSINYNFKDLLIINYGNLFGNESSFTSSAAPGQPADVTPNFSKQEYHNFNIQVSDGEIFTAAVDLSYGSDRSVSGRASWHGEAFYLKAVTSQKTSVAIRHESFSDPQRVRLTGAAGSFSPSSPRIKADTVNINYNLNKSTTLRVEYRSDRTEGEVLGIGPQFKNEQKTLGLAIVGGF